MKSQPYSDTLTELMDLVEQRMILRSRLPELDTLIRQQVLAEYEAGTPVERIAQVVGVSKQRIYDLIAVLG